MSVADREAVQVAERRQQEEVLGELGQLLRNEDAGGLAVDGELDFFCVWFICESGSSHQFLF